MSITPEQRREHLTRAIKNLEEAISFKRSLPEPKTDKARKRRAEFIAKDEEQLERWRRAIETK